MSGEIQVKPANFVDETILSHADAYSPTEISDMLSGRVNPQEVHDRGKALLKSRKWLDLAEQDQLITHKLNKILIRLEGQFLDLDNAMAQVKILKELGNRLDKRSTATETDLNTLYANQGKIMAQVYDVALSYMKGALRDQIDPAEWDAAKAEALRHAQTELQKYEAIEA